MVCFVGAQGHSQPPANASKIGKWVSHQRDAFRQGTLSDDRVSRLEALPGWTWNVHAGFTEKGFGLLSAFVQREGHSLVPARFVESGFKLGTWVSNQRTSYRTGELPVERVQQLESLPGWSWNLAADQWGNAFESLKAFVDREGHAQVPKGFVESGFRLDRWVNVQRKSFRLGEISEDRINQLEALPGWTWSPHEKLWEESFRFLTLFAGQEGHSQVSVDHVDPSGFTLGRWTATQRANYRRGALSKDRINRLEALPGWTWSPFDGQWEKGFSNLAVFLDREGHSQVPQRFQESGFNLGRWVTNNRRSFRRGALSKDRADRLKALPGWVWNSKF
jgi:hypothetical protein